MVKKCLSIRLSVLFIISSTRRSIVITSLQSEIELVLSMKSQSTLRSVKCSLSLFSNEHDVYGLIILMNFSVCCILGNSLFGLRRIILYLQYLFPLVYQKN